MKEKRFIKNGPGERGFSLIEVLIAMSILSVGLLALAQMQIVALKLNSSTKIRSNIMTVAQQAMEEVVDAEWGEVSALEGTETVMRGGVECTVEIDAQNEGVPADNTRIVEVMVSWQDGCKDKSFAMKTVKSAKGDYK